MHVPLQVHDGRFLACVRMVETGFIGQNRQSLYIVHAAMLKHARCMDRLHADVEMVK